MTENRLIYSVMDGGEKKFQPFKFSAGTLNSQGKD